VVRPVFILWGIIIEDLLNENSEAVGLSSAAAGEYLAEIGKSDLATFTGDEWNTLLRVIIKNYVLNAVPF
jgi:hypothetical protein